MQSSERSSFLSRNGKSSSYGATSISKSCIEKFLKYNLNSNDTLQGVALKFGVSVSSFSMMIQNAVLQYPARYCGKLTHCPSIIIRPPSKYLDGVASNVTSCLSVRLCDLKTFKRFRVNNIWYTVKHSELEILIKTACGERILE